MVTILFIAAAALLSGENEAPIEVATNTVLVQRVVLPTPPQDTTGGAKPQVPHKPCKCRTDPKCDCRPALIDPG